MPVDAKVNTDNPVLRADARRKEQELNMLGVRFVDFNGDPNVTREPDYYLYIFNIAPRSFMIRRPPNFPCLTLAACPEGQSYALVGRVPNVVNEKWIDDNGQTQNRGILGERFATDLLNPSNLGIDIWAEITDDQMNWIDGGTDDMTRRGLFWSRNERPTEDELRRAKAKMERHYRALLTQADKLHREGKMAEIGPEHHYAADYFRVKSLWHTVAELPSECPNCGDEVKKGIAFHMTTIGTVCVLDWKRAVQAGVKKKEDVPEDMRWWKEKGA